VLANRPILRLSPAKPRLQQSVGQALGSRRMGLLGRLFGGGTQPRGHTLEVESIKFDDCTEWVAAVGESFYQPALRSICGSRHWEDVRFKCEASLVPEPNNPHNTSGNAVAVYAACEGQTHQIVGHLSHGDALDYRNVVAKAKILGRTIVCDAHIAGRGPGNETPNLGIWLELPLPEACLTQLSEPIDAPAQTVPSCVGNELDADRKRRTAAAKPVASLEPMTGRIIPDALMDWSHFDAECRRVEVMGYDFHQDGLRTATGGLVKGTDRYEGQAELVLEPDNPHDPKACKVMLDGQHIGYLKRSTAKSLNKRLLGIAERGDEETYVVLIRDRGHGVLQAHLQIPYDSRLLAGYKNPKGRAKPGP
jgi:hypothetical protein